MKKKVQMIFICQIEFTERRLAFNLLEATYKTSANRRDVIVFVAVYLG